MSAKGPENSASGLWAVKQIRNIPNRKHECQPFSHDAPLSTMSRRTRTDIG
jgi:hypothetical protein